MLVPRTLGLALVMLAIALPLLEVAVMIKVASLIGFWLSLAAIMATGVLGVWVLQTHGFVMMGRFAEAMNAGRPPLEPVIEGVLLLAAGMLLISPGFICDTVGALLLVPPARQMLAKLAHDRLGGPEAEAPRDPPRDSLHRHHGEDARPDDEEAAAEREMRRARGAGPILEGEFERVDDPPRERRDKS